MYQKNVGKRRPSQRVGVDIDVWKHVLPAGADILSVSYRCSMLGLLEMRMRSMWTGGELSEATFKVAAKMDLTWMAVGVAHKGMEMDELLAQVHQEAAS